MKGTSKRKPEPPTVFLTTPELLKGFEPAPLVSIAPSLWMSRVPVLLKVEPLSRLGGCVEAESVAFPPLSIVCVLTLRDESSVVMSNVVLALMMVWPAPLSVPPFHLSVPGVVTVNADGVEKVPPFTSKLVLLIVIGKLVATVPDPSMVTLPPEKLVPLANVYVPANGVGNQTSVPADIVHGALLVPVASMSRMPPVTETPVPALLNVVLMRNNPAEVLLNWPLFVIETADPSVSIVPPPIAVKVPLLTMEALFFRVRLFVGEL